MGNSTFSWATGFAPSAESPGSTTSISPEWAMLAGSTNGRQAMSGVSTVTRARPAPNTTATTRFRGGYGVDPLPGLTTEYTKTATSPAIPRVSRTMITGQDMVLGVATRVTPAADGVDKLDVAFAAAASRCWTDTLAWFDWVDWVGWSLVAADDWWAKSMAAMPPTTAAFEEDDILFKKRILWVD